MVVGEPEADTEGIFCRFLEHPPMKLRLLGLLPLTQAEIRKQMPHSYHTGQHTEGAVEEHRAEPDRRTYEGSSISRGCGT